MTKPLNSFLFALPSWPKMPLDRWFRPLVMVFYGFVLHPGWVAGQIAPIQFRPVSILPTVEVGGRTLAHSWAGGMACPQWHSMDLDGDGVQERIVFDRVDQSLMVYERVGIPPWAWVPAPRYIPLFPRFHSWVEFADFDGDGNEDIFCSTNGGIALYRNNGVNPPPPIPRFELRSSSITALWDFGFRTAIYVLSIDRPGIADLDGDGDLDILSFDNFEIGKINYFRNFSRERYGHSDSLDYVQVSRCWGRLVENQLNSQVILGLDTNCQTPLPLPSVLRPSHAGSTINLINLNRDSLPDLLLGDVEGHFLTYLHNGGSRSLARMTWQTSAPSFLDSPLAITKFPAAYSIPSNGTGTVGWGSPTVQDLVICPNEFYGSNLNRHVWHYRNLRGSPGVLRDSFALTTKSFVLEDMVHHYLKASPVVADWNGDSLPDLLVAYENSALKPCLALYRNKGTPAAPIFELVDSLFLRLDTVPIRNPRLAAGDLDGDGRMDLLIGHSDSTMMHYRNITTTSSGPIQFQRISYDYQGLRCGIELAPELGDLDGDGKPELLVGMRNGQIASFQNQGTLTNPAWVKLTDSLGRINVAESISGWAAPRVGDLNRDGQADLIIGSESGKVFCYPSIWSGLPMPQSRNDLFVYNYAGGSADSIPHGNWVSPALTDLNGDSFPDLLLGFFKGGLTHWRNTSSLVSVAELPKPHFTNRRMFIFPNPVQAGSTLNVYVTGGDPQNSIEWACYNEEGKVVATWNWRVEQLSQHASQGYEIKIPEGITSGIYQLVCRNSDGSGGSARVWIIR